LKEILSLDKKGKFILPEDSEDMHTAIENYLTQKYGPVGEKIHTGRSRNDQVLTALRLFQKEKLSEVEEELQKLTQAFENYCKKYKALPIPGYTHMQKAMPYTVGLWAESFANGLADDLQLVKSVFQLIDQSPLGSGAGYGLPIDVKRDFTAKLLGFAKVQQNSLYCQNSRGKFEAMILNALISILQTVNKFASDVMLFTTGELGYFTVHNCVTTGSSIMPQKKNGDLAELLRSKVHLVLGHYLAVVSLSANLPSSYNRDIQDTKKPVVESFAICLDCLKMTKVLLEALTPNVEILKKAMAAELYAAQEAIRMSFKGVPFRKAYKRVKQRYR
jgi:argininosuccinate lyase